MAYAYDIKTKLNELMEVKGINQKKLAEISGVPAATLSRFNKQGRYDIATLYAVADGLGVKIDDLFDVQRNEK